MDENNICKCLKICSQVTSDCDACTYRTPDRGNKTCQDLLMEDALKLIKKYQKEYFDLQNNYIETIERIVGGKKC